MRALSKEEHENGIFKAFQDTMPDFAGEAVTSSWGDKQLHIKKPDFICESGRDRRIGVELGEWLHQSQTKRARTLEILEGKIAAAALQRSFENWLNEYNVLLYPVPIPSQEEPYREERRDPLARKTEWPRFVSELFNLLSEFKDSKQPINYWNDFCQTPTLGQFLTGLRFYPTGRIPRGIRFKKNGWFSPEDARQALIELINKKTAKYQTLKQERGLDELCLVIYYNRALMLNSSYEGINGGIEVAVEQAREQMSLDHGPFDKAFLFLAFDPEMKVFMLWP